MERKESLDIRKSRSISLSDRDMGTLEDIMCFYCLHSISEAVRFLIVHESELIRVVNGKKSKTVALKDIDEYRLQAMNRKQAEQERKRSERFGNDYKFDSMNGVQTIIEEKLRELRHV